MKNAETILGTYLKQIEAGNVPSFQSLFQRYSTLLNVAPKGDELPCLTALMVILYPEYYGDAVRRMLRQTDFAKAMREAGSGSTKQKER
jgi:hypothetical protein